MERMSIPHKIIIDFRIVFDVSQIPPEKRESFKIRDYKTWAEEFKKDMESDPEFGAYTKVSFYAEEVI